LSLCLSFKSVSFASGPETNDIVVHGNKELLQKEYNQNTQFDGIKMSLDGYYALEINKDKEPDYLPVGRLDIDLSKPAEVEKALARNDIAEEIKEEIKNKYKIASETNKNIIVTLFSSQFLSLDASTASDETIYYVYNGNLLRTDRMYAWDVNTQYVLVKEGIKTATVAEKIINILLTGANHIDNEYVNFISTGINLLRGWINYTGKNIAFGHYDDFLQVRLIYDVVNSWTYGQVVDTWHLGLSSQKATVTNIASEQYYFGSSTQRGYTYPQSRDVNVVHKTKHFDDPWAIA